MNFDELINDPAADLSVSMIAKLNNKLCFIVQPERRWRKDEVGNISIPFGGIGGKVEAGEDLISALQRESLEEIGCPCDVLGNDKTFIPIVTQNQVLYTEIKNAPYALPEFIFKNKKSEPGRKDYTYIFAYKANILKPEKLNPLDNPAIIMMDQGLFLKTVQSQMTLKDAMAQGAIVNTRINLPLDAFLWPTPTPRGYAKLLSYMDQKSLCKERE